MVAPTVVFLYLAILSIGALVLIPVLLLAAMLTLGVILTIISLLLPEPW
jgi:hypothetical protein